MKLQDILSFLSARTAAPSSMGAQLDRLREAHTEARENAAENCIQPKAPRPDATRAARASEARILKDAPVIRCLDALARLKSSKAFDNKPTLARLTRACPGRGPGEIVIACLRVYHEWAPSPPVGDEQGGTLASRRASLERRGLLAVHEWARGVAPDHFPSKDDSKARQRAANLYADCRLALADWLGIWTRQIAKGTKLRVVA